MRSTPTRWAPRPSSAHPASSPPATWRKRRRSSRGLRASSSTSFGYSAGPKVHVIDVGGLGDPLLARLPCLQPWRVGHFMRSLPSGYEETIATGTNRLADSRLVDFYEPLALITRGPIWSGARWWA